MALLHHSTDTRNDAPVTDVMASNAATETRDTAIRRRHFDDFEERHDVRISRGSGGLAAGAILALLMSAWAGLVPFIGPIFGFSADGTSSWSWNEVHALGAVVPGAVGVLACVFVVSAVRRPVGLRSSMAFWGFVLFLCGAWLTVMPIVWPAIVGSYFHAAPSLRTLEYWLGYASGPGVLLAGFGAFVMGRSGRSRVSIQPFE
jgi:hypothetical protein